MMAGELKSPPGALERGNLSLVKAHQDYVFKLIATPGMKALVLDKDTMTFVATVVSQSEIISKEVYLTESIERSVTGGGEKKENMSHMKAVVFLRPTARNLELLRQMLKSPRFKEFHLFFSAILPPDYLRALAEADEHDLVRQVQEFYLDTVALHDNLFCLETHNSAPLYLHPSEWNNSSQQLFERNVQGVLSALLALKKRPVVRYCAGSELAKRVAFEVNRRMVEEAALFHGMQGAGPAPLLLVLDRRDDPVTPLLMQWTYRAMVHELLGIENNRVDMSAVPNIRRELREVVLAPHQDHFYRGSMLLNFGDLGSSIKDLVADYQRKSKTTTRLETIEDMQRFVDQYPEFRQMAGQVSKHVAVVSELSRLVELRQLLEVSRLEQDLACSSDHSSALEQVLKMVDDPRVQWMDKLRLVMLYALRYEDSHPAEIENLIRLLRDKAPDADRHKVNAVRAVLRVAGSKVRSSDIYGTKTLTGRFSKAIAALKGVENVYTQHRPLLSDILQSVINKSLSPTHFPFVDSGNPKEKPQLIYVYIVGGCTYEEAHAVATLSDNPDSNVKIILGGSTVHNSRSWINELLAAS